MGAARSMLRAIDRLVDAAVVGLLAAILALGCYALWDSNAVGAEASSERWKAYRPVPEGESYDELVAANPDVIGWLSVYGTNINYPICQGEDSRTYLTTDAMGNHSMSGALFIDPASSRDFSDFNTFIYGHHMVGDVMFGQVTDFARQKFFDEHRYGDLYAANRHWGLEFICFLSADAYDRDVYRIAFDGEDDEQAYVSRLLERASRQRKTAHADRIVCLSTCASARTNGRAVLVARLTDETYANPFAEARNAGTGVDALRQLPLVLVVVAGAVAAWGLSRVERRAGPRSRKKQKGGGA